MPRIGPAHAYPDELAAFLIARLEEAPRTIVGLELPRDEELIRSVLSAAFQTSMLRDEDRPITFRLIVAPRDAFDATDPREAPQRLAFDTPRAFTVHELRKLAPAVKYQRSVLAVYPVDGELRIWGILHTGPRWLHIVQGGRGGGPELVSALMVLVSGPGDLVVGVAGESIARLRAGEVSVPQLDVFTSKWLSKIFDGVRAELMAGISEDHGEVDPRIIGRIAANFIRRIVSTIRAARHGGSVLLVPDEQIHRVCREELVDLKYRFDDTEPRRRFRTLTRAMLRELHKDAHPARPSWSDYETSPSPAIAEGDDAVFELAYLVSALADVDGLVLMTQRFEIIGFGGIVSGSLPEVRSVKMAVDVEGGSAVDEPTTATGTRHLAIYRICAAMPEALGLVVSQDGSVRFVRSVDGVVTYWDQVVASAFGG